MIITQTPFRMSFFGGSTDFPDFFEKYGGAVISTTFDKYCYVTVRHLPRFFDYRIHLTYSKTEYANKYDDICHPAIRNAMKWLNINDIRLTYESDLPAQSGLGTSSSFAVGMLGAFYALKGEYADKRKLADDAIYLERTLCEEAGGIQDQIAASFGGLNRIDFSADGYTVRPLIIGPERKKLLNDSLLLYFTGFSRYSPIIQKKTHKALQDCTSKLLELYRIVDEAEQILVDEKSDLNEFGKMLGYTWNLKRGITDSISNGVIDEQYDKAIRAGALGGKLLGAGGGGFLLLYVEPERQPIFKKAMADLLEVPFTFENDGTKLIFNNYDTYNEPTKESCGLDTQGRFPPNIHELE